MSEFRDNWPGRPKDREEKEKYPPDPWASEVAEVFRSVINRPKSGLQATEPIWTGLSKEGFAIRRYNFVITIQGTGEEFNFICTPNRFDVRVYVSERFSEEDLPCFTSFHYDNKFSRQNPPKLKKQALILCKKLVNKAVYDVISS